AIAVVAVLLMVGTIVAGGVAYLGYVAKKRYAAAKQAYQKDDYGGVVAAVKGSESPASSKGSGSTAKSDDAKADNKGPLGCLLSAVTGGDTKLEPLPEWKPAPAALVSSPPVRIPLQVSLQIIHVGTDRTLGDFESVYKIDNVTKQSVHIKASQEFPKG